MLSHIGIIPVLVPAALPELGGGRVHYDPKKEQLVELFQQVDKI